MLACRCVRVVDVSASTRKSRMEVHKGDGAAKAVERSGRVIWLMLAASFVVVLNETILTVGIPHLMRDFDIDSSTAPWVSSAFLLPMLIVVPTTGYLIERFNTRTPFVSAMTLVALGTVFAAVAPSYGIL